MNRPQAVRQPPAAAVKPTQATAAHEKNPRLLTSASADASGLRSGFVASGFSVIPARLRVPDRHRSCPDPR